MKVLKIILLLGLMLGGLFSCESFNIKDNSYRWRGSISMLSGLSGVAHADDGICLSTCTTTKCANLVVHRNSSTSETVCSTNATSSYEFKFKENPNTFYHGLVIEIEIVDSIVPGNNRSSVQVVDANDSSDKNIDLNETIVSQAVKEHLLSDLDDEAGDLKDIYDGLKETITVDALNKALFALTGNYLLSDLTDSSAVASALALLENLEPTFLNEMAKKVLETQQESAVYSNLLSLCNVKYTKLHNTTEQIGNPPYCYVSLASIASGTLAVWNPLLDIPPECTFDPINIQMECNYGGPSSIEDLPATPVDLANYVKAYDYLTQNYENNSCYTSAYRFGGMVALDPTLKTITGSFFNNSTQSPSINLMTGLYGKVDPTYNTFLLAKVYSACVIDPTARVYCSTLLTDPAILQEFSTMATDGFCYF